jgi:hypothetical protein
VGYASSTVLADLDHHNRCGGDLRDVGGWAGSEPKAPGGKKRRARASDQYNWFTQSFGTSDLRDAKTLLDELGGVNDGER